MRCLFFLKFTSIECERRFSFRTITILNVEDRDQWKEFQRQGEWFNGNTDNARRGKYCFDKRIAFRSLFPREKFSICCNLPLPLNVPDYSLNVRQILRRLRNIIYLTKRVSPTSFFLHSFQSRLTKTYTRLRRIVLKLLERANTNDDAITRDRFLDRQRIIRKMGIFHGASVTAKYKRSANALFAHHRRYHIYRLSLVKDNLNKRIYGALTISPPLS